MFLPQFLGYLIVPTGRCGPGLVVMAMWVASAILYRRIVLKLTGNGHVASVSAFVYVVLAAGMGGLATQNSQEAIALFFVMVGVAGCLLRGGRTGSFLLGVCVACVFLIKPNLVSFGGAFLVLWAYDAISQGDWKMFMRRGSLSFFGFAGMLLLVTVYFAFSGRAYDFWDATFLFGFFEYGNRDVSLLEFWQRWVLRRLEDPFGGNHDIWQLPMFLVLFCVSLFGGIRLWCRGHRGPSVFLLSWLVLEYVMVLSFRQFFEHYLVMVCPVVSVLSVYFINMVKLSSVRLAAVVRVGLLVVFCGWYLLYCVGMVCAVRRNNTKEGWEERLEQYAMRNIGGEQIAVIGGVRTAGLMDFLKMKTPQKYCCVLMNHTFAKAAWRRREMTDDLLAALRSPETMWLFCERTREDIRTEFAECPDVALELSGWREAYATPLGVFYRREGSESTLK